MNLKNQYNIIYIFNYLYGKFTEIQFLLFIQMFIEMWSFGKLWSIISTIFHIPLRSLQHIGNFLRRSRRNAFIFFSRKYNKFSVCLSYFFGLRQKYEFTVGSGRQTYMYQGGVHLNLTVWFRVTQNHNSHRKITTYYH